MSLLAADSVLATSAHRMVPSHTGQRSRSALVAIHRVAPYGNDLGSVAFRTLVTVALCAIPAFVLRHSRQRWVARIDERGVTRHDGKVFAWSGFKSVKTIRRRANGPINHDELHFQDGSVHVYYQAIENAREVLVVVTALERGLNPFT